MLQRVSWLGIGALGLASLHCGTPSAGDPAVGAAGAASDTGVATEPALPDPAVLAPSSAPSADTALPEVGGQTGDDSGSIGLECDVVTASSLALDDASRLGFSANERIALALGSHEMAMRWVEPVYDASGTLIDHATHTTTSVRVEVELLSQEARLLERHDSLYDMDCEPRLQVDARLTVSSADGALAETADAVLELGAESRLVNLSAALPVAAIRGGYTFEPGQLGGQAPSALFFGVTFTRYGQRGRIVQQYGDGAESRALTSASWPDWQPCDPWGWVPTHYAEQRPSVTELVDDVRRLAPVIILGPGGESTPAQLELQAVPLSGCHVPPTDGASPSSTETVSAETQVTLTSDALPGPVHIPLHLVSNFSLASGEKSAFFASRACGNSSRYSPQDFVTQCGDWGVDLSGVDSVFLEIESGIWAASGYLVFHIRGMRSPACAPSDQGFLCPEDAPSGELEVVDLGSVRVVLGTP